MNVKIHTMRHTNWMSTMNMLLLPVLIAPRDAISAKI